MSDIVWYNNYSFNSSLYFPSSVFIYSIEFSDATLRHGRGLALMCTPSCGTLSAYERRVITVSCQSDIWGDYNDLLLCKVSSVDSLDSFEDFETKTKSKPQRKQIK